MERIETADMVFVLGFFPFGVYKMGMLGILKRLFGAGF